jgi:hypothetical protein
MDPNPMATIRHTAEFAVPQFSNHEIITTTSPAAEATDLPSCSWCGKPGTQVKKLLSGGAAGTGVHICNECVALCHVILRDELPDFA